MAMLWGNDWNPEALLTCPYDESHRIAAKRYQFHIVKCRKNHPDKDFVPCPFNARHIFLRQFLRKHIATCPDSKLIEPDIRNQALSCETGEVEEFIPERRDLRSNPVSSRHSPDLAEDWDAEAELYMAEKESKRQEEIRNSTTFKRVTNAQHFSDSSSDPDRLSPGMCEVRRALSSAGTEVLQNKDKIREFGTPPASYTSTYCGSAEKDDEYRTRMALMDRESILGKIQSANYVPMFTRSGQK